jgi:hypothetical protein
MEQRREPRFGTDQQVVVADQAGPRRPAQVTNVSPWVVALEMTGPVAPGALLRIEFPDSVACGEVVYCRPAAGAYYVGVKLEHALESLARLACILDELAAPA